MCPMKAIASAEEQIGKQLLAKVSHLRDEASEIAEQWQALGRMGGQREDHATALLAKLMPHLRDIERFAATCQEQIKAMCDDPFRDETPRIVAGS